MDCATLISIILAAISLGLAFLSLGLAGWTFVISIMRRDPIITPCHEEDGGPRWWFVNNANDRYPIIIHRIQNQTDYSVLLADVKTQTTIRLDAHMSTLVDIFLGPSEHCQIGYGGEEMVAGAPVGGIKRPKLRLDKKKSRVSYWSYVWPTGENQYIHLILGEDTDPKRVDEISDHANNPESNHGRVADKQ